jgi:hypothetical protein
MGDHGHRIAVAGVVEVHEIVGVLEAQPFIRVEQIKGT